MEHRQRSLFDEVLCVWSSRSSDRNQSAPASEIPHCLSFVLSLVVRFRSLLLLTLRHDTEDLGEVENCQKELAEIEEAKRGFGGQVQALEMKDAEVLGASKQLNGELAQIKKLQEDAKAPMLKYKMNISKLG